MSEFFHVILLLLVLAILALLLIGYLQAKSKIIIVMNQADAVQSRVNSISDKINVLYDKVSTWANAPDVVAKVNTLTEKLCNKSFPIVGQLC